MKIPDTRITADVAAQYGLVSDSIWQNNFQDVAIQHATVMARDAQVCEFIIFFVRVGKTNTLDKCQALQTPR